MSETRWMGLSETYEVKTEDGSEYTVTTKMADVLKLEKINKGRSFIGGVPSVSELLSLIWLALRRTNQIDSKDREGWALTVEDFGRVDSDEEDDDAGVEPTE